MLLFTKQPKTIGMLREEKEVTAIFLGGGEKKKGRALLCRRKKTHLISQKISKMRGFALGGRKVPLSRAGTKEGKKRLRGFFSVMPSTERKGGSVTLCSCIVKRGANIIAPTIKINHQARSFQAKTAPTQKDRKGKPDLSIQVKEWRGFQLAERRYQPYKKKSEKAFLGTRGALTLGGRTGRRGGVFSASRLKK